jgi:S-(hydroxymethyl)glutathione dehydrogenase/alcohol dehydrogenase
LDLGGTSDSLSLKKKQQANSFKPYKKVTKTAVLTNYGDPLELWDIEWEPLVYGQVRLRVFSSGICGAQLQEIAGFKGNHLPRLLGHEGAGEVLEIGPGVKTLKVGDKACIHWRPGAGIESVNPEWNCDHGRYSAGLCTTFSEETVVSENRCTAIPWDTSIDLAVLLGCSVLLSGLWRKPSSRWVRVFW